MLAIPSAIVAGLLIADAQALQEPAAPQERIEVAAPVPVTSIPKTRRVGDSLLNGTVIGAAIGGGSTLGLLAKLCANNNCSDISASLDPRFALMGTLVGAGIGALIDALIEGRAPLSSHGSAQELRLVPSSAALRQAPGRVVMFARAGGANLTDDEGSLGSGGTWGGGIKLPLGRQLAFQAAYDRQSRRRNFEFGRSFSGREQIVTGKLLWAFRPGKRVMPYAGGGLGIMQSDSRSDSPTWTVAPGTIVVPGPVETLHTRSRSLVAGVTAGVEARLLDHLVLAGDLTLDTGGRQARASTRLTFGAGWRF